MESSTQKDEDDDSESKILSKLEALDRKIKNIESTLKRAEKSAPLINEDQLFFGLVLSLAVLLVTLPEFDLCTIFANFGFRIENYYFSTRVFLIGSLMPACGLRYYVTFAQDKQKNKIRAISVGFLLFPIYWLVTDLANRGLGTVLRNQNAAYIFLSPLIVVAFAFVFGRFVEREWYSKYGDYDPLLSLTFAALGLFIIIAYGLSIIVAPFVSFSYPVVILIMLTSLVLAFSFVLAVIRSPKIAS